VKLVAFSFITLSGLALFGHALLSESTEPLFGIVGLLLAVAWVLLTWRREKRAAPSAFMIALVGLSCASAAESKQILLPAIAAAAALFAWDACLAGARLRADSEGGSRRIVLRYALTSWVLLGVGLGVALIAQWIELRMSYGLAIGLALALLLCGLVAIRLIAPPKEGKDEPGDASQDQEKAGRHMSPGSSSSTGSME